MDLSSGGVRGGFGGGLALMVNVVTHWPCCD
jgi:hypothetical protein